MLLHPPKVLVSLDGEVIFLHTELIEVPGVSCFVVGKVQQLGKEFEVVWPVEILDHLVYIGDL